VSVVCKYKLHLFCYYGKFDTFLYDRIYRIIGHSV